MQYQEVQIKYRNVNNQKNSAKNIRVNLKQFWRYVSCETDEIEVVDFYIDEGKVASKNKKHLQTISTVYLPRKVVKRCQECNVVGHLLTDLQLTKKGNVAFIKK